jgi:hypothetical protein
LETHELTPGLGISRDGGAISETNFSFPLTRKRSVVPFGKYDRLVRCMFLFPSSLP